MNTKLLLEYSIFIDLLITIGVLAVMARKHLRREFPSMVAFLCVCCVEDIVSIPLLFFPQASWNFQCPGL